MKKSRQVQLILITAALASCNRAMYKQRQYNIETDLVREAQLRDSINVDSCMDMYTVNDSVVVEWCYSFRPYTYNQYSYVNGQFYYAHGFIGVPVRHYTSTTTRHGFGKAIVAAGS